MRNFVAILVAVALLAAQLRPAFAQEPAPQPAPQVVYTEVAPQGPPQVVRVNFRSKERATIYDRSTGRLLCATPCTADVPVGAPLRVVLEGGEDEPHDFVVTGEHGAQADVEIKRGGRGALAGGIVMVSLGGVFVLTSLVLFAISAAAEDSTNQTIREEAGGFRTAGLVTLIIGGGLAAGGIVLLSNRSREATTRQKATPPYGSKAEIFRSDMLAGGGRDPLLPPAPQQLGWTFAF